jgi:hypothetical protein
MTRTIALAVLWVILLAKYGLLRIAVEFTFGLGGHLRRQHCALRNLRCDPHARPQARTDATRGPEDKRCGR